MKRRILTVLFLGLILFMASCDKFTAANFSQVETGQTEEQVKNLIGPPTSISTGSFLIYTGTVYKYEKNGKKAELGFVNGKLIYKNGEL